MSKNRVSENIIYVTVKKKRNKMKKKNELAAQQRGSRRNKSPLD